MLSHMRRHIFRLLFLFFIWDFLSVAHIQRIQDKVTDSLLERHSLQTSFRVDVTLSHTVNKLFSLPRIRDPFPILSFSLGRKSTSWISFWWIYRSCPGSAQCPRITWEESSFSIEGWDIPERALREPHVWLKWAQSQENFLFSAC